jgi:hypothetical protein
LKRGPSTALGIKGVFEIPSKNSQITIVYLVSKIASINQYFYGQDAIQRGSDGAGTAGVKHDLLDPSETFVPASDTAGFVNMTVDRKGLHIHFRLR